PNFFFRLAQVLEVDTKSKRVITNIGEVHYDYLVVATGSQTNFYGIRGIEIMGMAMKSIPQALNLRSLILENFEQALLTDDLHAREALMNLVIVGGGPTGVAVAGALAEVKKGGRPKDYPDLHTRRVQINLVHGGERLLDAMSEKASKKAEKFLEGLGVNVWKEAYVKDYDGNTASTNTELVSESATLIWAAGVHAVTLKGMDGPELLARGRRLKVNPFHQVEGFKEIFAIGDVAHMVTEAYPDGHPMMAQPAIQQGRNLGDNLVRL